MSTTKGQQNFDYAGQTLDGRYSVEKLLGQGGMGSVYAGRHRLVGKRVAIKILHGEYVGNEEVVKRFYREAQASATIAHKNIIDVLDVGLSPRGEPYFVMEYLEGESLADLLRRVGPLDLEAALGVMEPALLALQAAHDKGIIHRDLKPDNIFLVHEPGGELTIKLIDFGISKFSGDANQSRITQTGSLMGTPTYMSPEQARCDQAIDARSDVYAMGVILYEMLAGDVPFEGETFSRLILNVLTESPRLPHEINPAFPQEALPLVYSALAKTPEDRPASALAFLEQLKHLSAFADRKTHLTRFSSTIKERVAASGDLGATISISSSGRSAAAGVFFQMMQAGTSRIRAATRMTQGGNKRRTPLFATALAVVVIAVAAGSAAVVSLMRSKTLPPSVASAAWPSTAVACVQSQSIPPASKEPTAAQAARSVRIKIVGAPTDAKIFYDNAPVPLNPFPVERTQALIKLEVRADGYAPFTTMVLPNEDREVRVTLVRVEPEHSATAAPSKDKSEATAKKQKVTPSKPPPAPKAGKPRIKRSGRGTSVAQAFE